MDKRLPQKHNNKPMLVKLNYQQVELGESAIPALDRAFSILFDEVLRRRERKAETPKNETLTSKSN